MPSWVFLGCLHGSLHHDSSTSAALREATLTAVTAAEPPVVAGALLRMGLWRPTAPDATSALFRSFLDAYRLQRNSRHSTARNS